MYYVASKHRMLVTESGTIKIGKQESFYHWFTPYVTKEEAEKARDYLIDECGDKAQDVKILTKKEFEER